MTFLLSLTPLIPELSDENKFTWLLNQEDKIISLTLANYIQKATLLRNKELEIFNRGNEN